MAEKGLRVLALAERELEEYKDQKREQVETELVFVGLVALQDPPKEEAKAALQIAKRAGVRPVMITGDNPITARAIASSINLFSSPHEDQQLVLTGAQLDELDSDQISAKIKDVQVFARVNPAHKSILVDAFQKAGYYVAMLGDGVNDAPSIKKANVGVAMGSGSDVTRSASDLVLLDDNYETLVHAIEEGRNILHRIRLFVAYLLSCNCAEIVVFIVAILFNLPMPLTAIMLLLMNVITDAAPALAMGKEPGDPDVMNQPPRGIDDPVINKPMWWNIGIMTVAACVAVMVSYKIGLQTDLATGRTMAYLTLCALEVFRGFTARSNQKSVFKLGFFSNKWMNYAVVFSMALTFATIYFGESIFRTVPLGLELLAIGLGLSLIGPVVEELSKPFIRKMAKK